MNNALMNKLLFVQTNAGREVDISVVGTSMHPTLYENDEVTVKKFDDYVVGDILVFTYKSGELLVHRLLKKEKDKYFCKGDNAFRLEDIVKEQIAGKVIRLNGQTIAPCSQLLISLSYLVNRTFVKCGYDTQKVKSTPIYKHYQRIILEKEEKNDDLQKE